MIPSIMTTREGKPIRIVCCHWRTFPPGAALHDKTAEELWKSGELKPTAYQQYQVWKRICGRFKMGAQGCLECPMVRIMEMRNHLPVMVSLDGLVVTPTTDIPTMEATPSNRGNCVRQIRPKHDWLGSGIKDPDKDE